MRLQLLPRFCGGAGKGYYILFLRVSGVGALVGGGFDEVLYIRAPPRWAPGVSWVGP